MVKKVCIFLLVCACRVTLCAQTKIVLTDINHFWEAYDRIHASSDSLERIQLIQQLYLNRASQGLKAMMEVRQYKDYEYVHAILSYPAYWNSIRRNTDRLIADKQQMEIYFAQLKAWYPALKPAEVYFPIGVFRSAGTYQDLHVLMGAEFLLADEKASIHELPDRVQQAMKAYMPYDIPCLALHELIHTQQKRWEHLGIVQRSVAEGVAEFISTLISGKPVSPPVRFGMEHQQKVLDRYMTEIFRQSDWGNWLWGQNENELKQNDLGYYIGYEICARFYQKATDKQKAIRDLLELDYENDMVFGSLVDQAGFLPLTWQTIQTKFEALRPKITAIREFENGSQKVMPTLHTITLEFSEPMSPCCRSIEDYTFNPRARLIPIKRFIGWSADYRLYTIETGVLEPGTDYELTIMNFAKDADGNRIRPYTIRFKTVAQ